MKKVLLSFILLFLLLLGVLFYRTLFFTSRQLTSVPASTISVDAGTAAEHLAGAVRFQTVSNQGSAGIDVEAFSGLHKYLQETYPLTHEKLTREVIAEHSLLYTWKGTQEKLKPIILMSHLDVVPVPPGSESSWTHPPFSGDIYGGYVWGRGTMDDKVGVIGLLEAVEKLLGQGFQPGRTIYLAFGHDEEIGGVKGAASIAARLKEIGAEAEFTLDEGMTIIDGVIPGLANPMALIGIAEKGYVSLELSVSAEGGHSSMPPRHTAIGILSTAIEKLENNPMPHKLRGPTLQAYHYIGPEMGLGARLIFANLWLFNPLAIRQISRSPAGDASIRTTTAVTMIDGGVKENVLPTRARAVVNFRILPGDTISKVRDYAESAINDPRVRISLYGDFRNEPSPVSDVNSHGFGLIQKSIMQSFPGTLVAPNLVVGGTDTKHYEKLSKDIYRFLPIHLKQDDLKRYHGIDERVGVENLGRIVVFYSQLILNAAGG
ncbi:MAG: M20 family peptidase [Blastocatellales bacterium]